MFGSPNKKNMKKLVKLNVQTLDQRDVPAVIATPESYSVAAGQTITIPFNKGVLANDFSNSNPTAILTSSVVQGPQVKNQATSPALPANTLTLNSNGSFTFTAPSNLNIALNSPITFIYKASDLSTNQSATATVTVNVTGNVRNTYAVASGPGVASQVQVYDSASGLLKFTLNPFEAAFTGGVRVTTADLNRDGTDDVIVGAGNGGGPIVAMFDGANGTSLGQFFAFEPTFRGGIEVAAGNFNGNGNELAVGAGIGGGPRISIFNFQFGLAAPISTASFFAYESTQRNGVHIAAGDLDNSGLDKLISGAGPGGGPAIKVYGAAQLFSGNSEIPAESAFFAFDSTTRTGVHVAVGQFRGDGRGDIVAGTGGGGGVVRIFDGRSNAQIRALNIPSDGSISSLTLTGNSGNLVGVGSPNGLSPSGGGSLFGSGGAQVAVTDRNGDGRSDIIVGSLSGQPRVRIYDGNSLTEISNFLAFNNSFSGGVWVGGNSL
jgi:hypothetical protein